MPVSIFLVFSWISLLSEYSMLRFFKENPIKIKASVEGEIKGHHIRCEKTLELGEGKWGVMCGIDNGLDIKYRHEKIIAAPSLLVKKSETAKNVVTTNSSYLTIIAERANECA